MDGWSRRLFYLGIAVIMALGLLLAPAVTPQASAAGVDSEWSKVATPDMDDWFVAPGFNVYDYAVDAEDTVIYAVGDQWMDANMSRNVTDDELFPKLLKSEDGGATWSDKSKALNDAIGDDALNFSYSLVAVAPDNPDFVAVSVWNTSTIERQVLYSYDGGKKFRDTGAPAHFVKSGVYPIPLAMSISPLYGDDVRNLVVVGADDMFGSVGIVERHRFEGEKSTGTWINTTDPSNAYNWSGCEVVTSVEWSPNFVVDSTILVVTYDGSNGTRLQHGWWSSDEDEMIEWNEAIAGIKTGGSLITNDGIGWSPRINWTYSTGIALPSDYDGDDKNSRRALVYVNNNSTGTIYTVDELYGNVKADALKKQISGQPYLASLDYCGDIAEGKAVAGVWGNGTADLAKACAGVQVYRTGEVSDMDTDKRWVAAADYKLPSGIGPAQLSYATDEGNKIYALTSGVPYWYWYRMVSNDTCFRFSESALSVSFNDGESWNQIGLINTDIGYLTDIAAGADCNTTILASIPHNESLDIWNGTCSSVWLKAEALPEYASEYNGKWLRVWYGDLGRGIVRLAPEETTEVNTVYLADLNTPTLYYTESKGLVEWELDTKSPLDFADLAVKAAKSIYAVADDGDVALFDGTRWPSANRVDSDLKAGNTIAVLGDSVLVGGTSADVSYSSDAGLTFTELKDGLPDSGDVFVAFDSYFDTNKVVYAAVSGGGIYRWTIDESDEWKDIKAGSLNYTGIVLDRAGNPKTSATTGGVLYAAYYNATASQSGVARCLTPASEKCCGAVDWDYLTEGLANETFNIEPVSLKICGCLSPDTNSKLMAIDTSNPYYNMTLIEEMNDETSCKNYVSSMGRLWSYEDCFAKAAPVMSAPADKAVINSDPCNCWNDAFTLKWERQCDACEYDIQIATDPEFTEMAVRYSGPLPVGDWNREFVKVEDGANPSYVVPNRGLGDGSCGSTYYWRVRARHAETGQDVRSPWSEARTFTIAAGPEARVKLTNPANGAVVPPTNIQFTWDIVPDATGYVFSLKNPVAGTDVVASTNVAGTTYTYIGTLSYDTPYLWTVKAMKGEVVFGEATATFTTASAPVEVPPPSTPAWVWVIIAIGAVLVIVTLVLIFRTRRV